MFFGSTLIWYSAVEQYDPSLKTIDELIASGMELGIDKRTRNYFEDQFSLKENQINAKIPTNLIYCNSTNACLSRIVRDR